MTAQEEWVDEAAGQDRGVTFCSDQPSELYDRSPVKSSFMFSTMNTTACVTVCTVLLSHPFYTDIELAPLLPLNILCCCILCKMARQNNGATLPPSKGCGGWLCDASRRLTRLQNLSCVTNSRRDHGKVSVEWVAQNPPSKWHQDVLQGAIPLKSTWKYMSTWKATHCKNRPWCCTKLEIVTRMKLTVKVWFSHFLTQEFFIFPFSLVEDCGSSWCALQSLVC